MSGVVINGIQFERCNGCGEYVAFDHMFDEPSSPVDPIGRVVCERCHFAPQESMESKLVKAVHSVSQPIPVVNCVLNKPLGSLDFEKCKDAFPELMDGFVVRYTIHYGEHEFPFPLYATLVINELRIFKDVSQKWL